MVPTTLGLEPEPDDGEHRAMLLVYLLASCMLTKSSLSRLPFKPSKLVVLFSKLARLRTSSIPTPPHNARAPTMLPMRAPSGTLPSSTPPREPSEEPASV